MILIDLVWYLVEAQHKFYLGAECLFSCLVSMTVNCYSKSDCCCVRVLSSSVEVQPSPVLWLSSSWYFKNLWYCQGDHPRAVL